MRRRKFLMSTAALCATPGLGFAYSAQDFSPSLWRDVRQAEGVVILNYRASWSLTCARKEEIIVSLLQENPAYQALTFIDVDWDTFGPSELTKRLKVNRRSTLLVMKAGKEVARLENEPYERKIRRLLDAALAV
jgi:thiol:disulfide interchange protein